MGKPVKVLVVTAFVVVLAFLGLGAYVRWSVRHMVIAFPVDGLVRRLLVPAEIVAAATGGRETCANPVDQSSIGDREAEAAMSYIAAMDDLYRTRFGSSPSSMSDLSRLAEFEQADSLNKHSFSRGCSVYFDQSGSFATSCGRSRPSGPDVAAFMRNAPFAQKFYMVGKSEILYIPVQKC